MKRQILLILCLLTLVSLSAKEYFVIDNYVVDIQLTKDNAFQVTERITVNFSTERHGIFREIPTKYKLLDGSTRRISIFDIQVEERRKKVQQIKDKKVIRIGHPQKKVSGIQEYVITYTVGNALLYNENGIELIWDLVGTQWDTNIHNVEFSVEWPSDVRIQDGDYRLYASLLNIAEENKKIALEGSRLVGGVDTTLTRFRSLTVAVNFPLGTFADPPFFRYLWIEYQLFAIPLGMILMLILVYLKFGWDAPVEKTMQAYPPEELVPSEAGILIDDTANNRDIFALIPYWAIQGLLEIRELEPEKGGSSKKKPDLELTKLKDLPEDRPKYEKLIFKALFKNRDQVKTTQLKTQFSQKVLLAKDDLYKTVLKKKYYTQSSIQWNAFFPIIYLTSFIGMGVSVAFGWIALILPFLATFFIGAILQGFMLKKNEKGRALYKELKGFKRFLEKADKAEIAALLEKDPAYYDKTLPYAVAFNLTSKWSKRFEPLLLTAPSWYHFYNNHNTGGNTAFAQQLDNGLKTVQSSFSSGYSGGSGGTSGGGGFGGGGGGSW